MSNPLDELAGVVDEYADSGAVFDPDAAPPADEVSPRVVDEDTPCVDCGYNVRGLALSGHCPECGAMVERSVHGDLLVYSDPRWLKQVGRGLGLVCGAFASYLLAAFGLLMAAAVLPELALFLAGVLVLLVMIGMLTGGAFLVTAPEPRLSAEEQPVTLRMVVRISSVIAGASLGLSVVDVVPQLAGASPWWLSTIGGYGLYSVVVLFLGGFAYLRRLALRVPDESLARSTTIVMCGLSASVAFLLVNLQLLIESSRYWSMMQTIGIIIACLAGFAFAVGSVVVLYGYWHVFKYVRQISKWTRRKERAELE